MIVVLKPFEIWILFGTSLSMSAQRSAILADLISNFLQSTLGIIGSGRGLTICNKNEFVQSQFLDGVLISYCPVYK